jgi:hypothetical protein
MSKAKRFAIHFAASLVGFTLIAGALALLLGVAIALVGRFGGWGLAGIGIVGMSLWAAIDMTREDARKERRG